MKFFQDMVEFIKSLSFVDIVFFFAILVLMILVVTLIYFIKINNDEPEVIEKLPDNKVENLEETAEMKIVKDIQKALNENEKIIPSNEYEKDQEEKAIISYDELKDKHNNYHLNYETENLDDDLLIKKVNLEDFSGANNTEVNFNVRVISFAKEEAFLEALKKLQQELG